jgi:hypothetical protein
MHLIQSKILLHLNNKKSGKGKNMVRCQKCGHTNDNDATFCENCGANLKSTFSRGLPRESVKNEGGMNKFTKILIVVCVILVAGLGITAGALIEMNKVGTAPITNTSSVSQSTNPTSSNAPVSTVQYKTFSNGKIYFQYPSSWGVLPNTANIMAIVGFSNYPSFSVYDESKYGYTSLAAYVSSSKSQMTANGYSIISEQNNIVDGLSADEIVYQGQSSDGKTITQQMDLVEKTPGSQYFALVGVDNVDNYDQDSSTFNQIINSFKFTS